ncbi:MAG TPA: nitrogenase-stabilizing/protective protein NifW [Azospirillum sp.]|nr:nitrogenase-stabilizing/protective protein NifW [Azospirillum sp.]
MSFKDDFEDLETAEDFLTFLGVPYERRVVDVNRLHILQRFHDYLAADTGLESLTDDADLAARHRAHLERAYQDFVASTGIAEKTFKVHQQQAERMSDRFVSLESLVR